MLDYDIGDIRTGRGDVPRLFLTTMPQNYFEIDTIPERKQEFLRILLPLVLLANEEIRAERQHLLEILALRQSGEEIPASAREELEFVWLEDVEQALAEALSSEGSRTRSGGGSSSERLSARGKGD